MVQGLSSAFGLVKKIVAHKLALIIHCCGYRREVLLVQRYVLCGGFGSHPILQIECNDFPVMT
jgi:hypothetical protein